MKAFLLAGAAAAAMIATPALAGLGDWSISPWSTNLSDISLTVGGRAQGTAFTADQPVAAGVDQTSASGAATLTTTLERDYDSGLSLALKGAFEVYHDRLSGDNYGDDFVQKVYATAQTGLGRAEIGMTDGAAYTLAVTGPVVDDATTMDNTNATFFRDPSTGRAFVGVFALNSAVESSLNYAKISYYTPRLFGVQLAASYTPSEGKDAIPFLSAGPHVTNRQKSIWEGALSYSDNFGPVALGVYGGFAFAHAEDKTAGHEGLTEWGLGSEIDYNLNDDVKLAVGGAYRQSNAYAFAINDAQANGETSSGHLSATLSDGPWIVGGEVGDGTAEGAPKLGVHGVGASLGYVFNSNLQATLGWQQLRYDRDVGTFYNGAPRIRMDAVFLHLSLHV
ncbi:MAG: porin [Rhizomicrobium sp.]